MSIDARLIDVDLPHDSGYSFEVSRDDNTENMKGAVSDAGGIITDFPNSMWIEPRDWPAVARELLDTRTRAIDYVDRFTNQDPTHECTSHCFRTCFEGARNRQRRIAIGPPVAGQRLDSSAHSASVWVSPLSVYAEANPGQWGGAGVRQILGIATRRGVLPDKVQPREYGFKHTLHGTCGQGGVNQSHGPWVPLSRFPDGWQETAKHFKPVEYIFPDSWEQTVCLVLNGLLVGVGRNGHSIPYAEWMPDDQVMKYVDSYDVCRFDSISRIKSTVGDSYAIVSTTIPDSWDKPAGVAA